MIEITTNRLVLRKAITETEKNSLVSLLNDWDVARWLTNVPYPYTYNDLEDYLLISNSYCFGDPGAGREAEQPFSWKSIDFHKSS